ncbi:hypothetical protein Q3G72_030330 [Acer saccharum]|nr:hypothetical protein Q3G72_030330 [Acer saccharum]
MTVNVGVSDYIIWLMSYVCLRSQSGKELEGMCCTWGGCQSGVVSSCLVHQVLLLPKPSFFFLASDFRSKQHYELQCLMCWNSGGKNSFFGLLCLKQVKQRTISGNDIVVCTYHVSITCKRKLRARNCTDGPIWRLIFV